MYRIFFLSILCLLVTHFVAFNSSYVVAYREAKLVKQASQPQDNVQTQKTELLAFLNRNNQVQRTYTFYKTAADDFYLIVLEAQRDHIKVAELAAQANYAINNRKANLASHDLVKDLPDAVVKWDKAALIKLATDMNGVKAFENLRTIMDIANGNTSEKTVAQRILLDLTKNAQDQDDYARVQQLYLDLTDVAAHTTITRKNLLDGLNKYEQQLKQKKMVL